MRDLFDGERGLADENRGAGVLVSLAHGGGPLFPGCERWAMGGVGAARTFAPFVAVFEARFCDDS